MCPRYQITYLLAVYHVSAYPYPVKDVKLLYAYCVLSFTSILIVATSAYKLINIGITWLIILGEGWNRPWLLETSTQ